MYLIFYLFLFTYLTKAYSFASLVPYQGMSCPRKPPLPNKLPTTLLDLDENSHQDLKTCLIRDTYINQPLLLIAGNQTKSNPLLQKYKTYEDPNIIIMTKHLTTKLLLTSSIKRVLRSHRSLVFITVTNENSFKCEDGDFNFTDLKTLQLFMDKIWRKYRIARVIMTFPFTCKNKMVIFGNKTKTHHMVYQRNIKIIDSNTTELRKSIEDSGVSLTEGYPLRANIFLRFPTSITDCENLPYYTRVNLNLTEGYCGLDAMVMHDIIRHFKFNPYFPQNTNCYKYGYVTDSNITGSLGCIVRKELDISFNSRFMTMYSEDYIYFLHYVATDSLCVILKRTDKIPLWNYPFTVYRPKLWMLITFLTLSLGVFLWIASKIKHIIGHDKGETLFFYMKDAFVSTMCGFSFMKKRKLYILRGTCLWSSVMFLAIYQGHINHIFTSLFRFETIKSLKTLYESDLNLYVSASMREILKQQLNRRNEVQRSFIDRIRLVPENYMLDFVIQHPGTALLGRQQDVVIEILTDYVDEDSSPLVYIVDECFATYYLSYIARIGFPFYEELQRFMQRIGEAGLPIIYYKWTCNMLRVPQSLPKFRNEPRMTEKIELHDQRLAFGILFAGQLVSLVIFIIEIIRGKRRQ